MNTVYQIPTFKNANPIVKALIGGWQASGVANLRTGLPFTPGFSVSGAGSVNQTGSNTEGARIGVGCRLQPLHRFERSLQSPETRPCFFAPSPGSLGFESGQNWLFQPGLINFDMSMQKEFAIKERLHFQMRVDAFNVFNHANFNNGLSTTLNFNSYTTNAQGRVTALPTITSSALGENANGSFNVTGFGTSSSAAPGAPGSPRVLQLVARITF